MITRWRCFVTFTAHVHNRLPVCRKDHYDSVKKSLFTMISLRYLAALAACTFLTACSVAASVKTLVAESQSAPTAPVASSPTPDAGKEAYLANCARCHGDRGQGTAKGIPMTSGHAIAHSADEYIKQIENGQGGNGRIQGQALA
jgi:mono/diheme cytochrome c family protein